MCLFLLVVFLLSSLICASRKLSITVDKITVNPANSILAMLVFLLTRVRCAELL